MFDEPSLGLAPMLVKQVFAIINRVVADGRIDTGAIASRSPQGRLGAPDEVAGLALFLASPAASHINGATLPVDGGWLANGAP